MSSHEKEDECDIIEIDGNSPEFTLAEVIQMEKINKQLGSNPISQDFYDELCAKFNKSPYRLSYPIKTDQIRNWFLVKRLSLVPRISKSSCRVRRSRSRIRTKRDKVPSISVSEAVSVLPNLMFEAKSAKDNAWFDVASFLAYRTLSSGELLVHVRFAGFGKEEDEWVNVKTAIRERSIPMEPSECNRINIGDPVMCFRESIYNALYYDAHVVGIERNQHESNQCNCVYVVQYDQDDFEEEVLLEKICCRPSHLSSDFVQECKAEPMQHQEDMEE